MHDTMHSGIFTEKLITIDSPPGERLLKYGYLISLKNR